jgi:small subunit ribosomal protein S13
MPRVSGIDIPNDKRIEIALTYIFGIGLKTSQDILNQTEISPDIRAKDLNEEQIYKINQKIKELELSVEGELKRIISQNVRRLGEIKSYRGLRHRNGLPTRGQRTRSNARTRKGKRKTVGGAKKKVAK